MFMRNRRSIYLFGLPAAIFARVLAGCDSSGFLPGIFSGGGGASEVINASFIGQILNWTGII